jgi:hypothetical protein
MGKNVVYMTAPVIDAVGGDEVQEDQDDAVTSAE